MPFGPHHLCHSWPTHPVHVEDHHLNKKPRQSSAWQDGDWSSSWSNWGWSQNGGWNQDAWYQHHGDGQNEANAVEEQGADAECSEVFWQSEEQSRLRNSSLTPMEGHVVSTLGWHERAKPNVNRFLANFGAKKGAGTACKALLAVQIAATKPVPGQVCSMRSPEFTLCKHLLISNWKGIGFPDIEQPNNLVKCYCAPRTSFMPAGCMHKRDALTSGTFYLQRFCVTCSLCLRCNKHLGHIFNCWCR